MTTITVGMATCGLSAGAGAVFETFQRLAGEGVTIGRTGCLGLCYREPLVEVDDGTNRVLYGGVDAAGAERIYQEHVLGGQPVAGLRVLDADGTGPEASFLERQVKIVLRHCGRIDPDSLEAYEAQGGYQALRKVLADGDPEGVIRTLQASGLRGRGGGGFPTGAKWAFARKSPGDVKYVICNADEGDPGAFMDRSVLEGDPHSVLEGMMIAGYAIGAEHGYLYCRAEYPLAVQRLRRAIADLEARGYLGRNLFGSSFSFELKLKEGAGAFVCGEETALMASIEGKRGTPRPRPPYPAVKGLWGKPTNINNVETYACVPWILAHGADAFAALGTEKSRGTKVFALAGKARRTGLVEVPMGITIRELVFDVCGGLKDDHPFKAVQMGGPSGGCIPASLADTPIDYERITATGAIMGSGGLVVLDDTTCMVDLARFFLKFTQAESCGKCTSCRIGTLRMLEILEEIVAGRGLPEHLDQLEALANTVKTTSQCGLGQTAPNPVLTTLKYFRSEYEAHILDKRCPAHACGALVSYRVRKEACTGCTLCARACPADCIESFARHPHTIDASRCIRCGKCFTVCPFDAIEKD